MPSVIKQLAFAAVVQTAATQPLRAVPQHRPIEDTSGCTPDDTSFDNLLLVQQWPGTLEMNAPGFTMHGLWPSRTGSNVDNYPCQCTNETFDVTEVKSIISDLNQYWPSDKGGNEVFWKHEYEKHGTCAEAIDSLGNELKFMQGALALRSKADTQGTLEKAKISPSFTDTYAASDLASALSTAAIFKCNSSNYLTEIAICYDKTLSPIDCEDDAYGGTNCQDGVHYIPATGWAPSAAPSPAKAPAPHSTDKCEPNKHGPPCTTDDQCKQYTDCIRCASSGYCTLVPALHLVDVPMAY